MNIPPGFLRIQKSLDSLRIPVKISEDSHSWIPGIQVDSWIPGIQESFVDFPWIPLNISQDSYSWILDFYGESREIQLDSFGFLRTQESK